MTIRGPSPLKMLCFEGEAKVHSRRLKRCFTPKRRRNPVHAHINLISTHPDSVLDSDKSIGIARTGM